MSLEHQPATPDYPTRFCEITGPSLKSMVYTEWALKYGVWFLMKADYPLKHWVSNLYGVLCEPSLELFCRRENLKFRWLS